MNPVYTSCGKRQSQSFGEVDEGKKKGEKEEKETRLVERQKQNGEREKE